MRIALLHGHYSESHLENVMKAMEVLGPPEIHAIWDQERDFWIALEGCHRIRAAARMEIEPVIVPVEYEQGKTTWKDIGLEGENIAKVATLDRVHHDAGGDVVLGFGEHGPPKVGYVRRPKEGEVMKYRIIQEIGIDTGKGRILSGVGTVFTSDEVAYDVTDLVSGGHIEIVEDEPQKKTVEVRSAPKKATDKR